MVPPSLFLSHPSSSPILLHFAPSPFSSDLCVRERETKKGEGKIQGDRDLYVLDYHVCIVFHPHETNE